MTKTENQRPKTGKYVWIIFAVIIIFIYFFGLTVPLLGPDEPRYAQIAREMFERGDWITPKLGNFDWFEKPALLYWLQIFSYKIFGVSEFAARFGSAIFGLGTIFSLWILGKRVQSAECRVQSSKEELTTNNEQQTTNNFANWLALIAASSIGLLVFSRGASFDIILTFPVTASLVAYFLFDQKEKKSDFTFYFLLFTFYFFIGIALIAKGLIGIIFPFAIVAFYYLLSWKLPSKTFIISLIWGTILSLIVASVWYLPMYLENGWKFIDEFFIQHHFQRYVSNKYQHPQPFWFFWLVLPLMTIPWLPFFLASIWNLFGVQSPKSKVQSPNKSPRPRVPASPRPFSTSPLLRFAFAWMFVPLVFFSVSGSKLPGYILPALPGALILTADFVCKFVQKSKARAVALQILAFLMFVVIAILLQFAVPKFAYADSVKGLMETANAQGFSNEKVLNMHTISHNSEFYAAGRLIRTDDGKIKKFLGVSEIVEQIKRENDREVLVLVPLEYQNELTTSDSVETKVLANNGELAIVLVKNKQN